MINSKHTLLEYFDSLVGGRGPPTSTQKNLDNLHADESTTDSFHDLVKQVLQLSDVSGGRTVFMTSIKLDDVDGTICNTWIMHHYSEHEVDSVDDWLRPT
jgi:hypothetical protein